MSIQDLEEELFTMDCPCKGKNLDRLLQPAILQAVSRQPLHGLAIVQAVAEGPMWSGTQPDPTGVYRYLKKMEQAGLLRSTWEVDRGDGRPRRMYEITDHGRACRNNWAVALNDYAAAIARMVEELQSEKKWEEAGI